MRLAVSGPISPVALARQVREAVNAGRRGPTAAGFQLVEIAACLDAAGAGEEGARPSWSALLGEGRRAVMTMLSELAERYPAELGPKTSFARYAREVVGWRRKEAKEDGGSPA
jgi:AcrR family transcriptional regulator